MAPAGTRVALLMLAALAPSITVAHDPDSDTSRDQANTARFRAKLAAAAGAMIDAVDRPPGFIEGLYGISRRDALLSEFGDPERQNWSYWPRRRTGLGLAFMDARQRRLAQAVLSTILSSRGYLQAVHIMQLEEVLAGGEVDGFLRGSEHYHLTIFGKPGAAEPWGLRFEGHHLSLNLTLTEEEISMTPSFFGSAPGRLRSGPLTGFGPLAHEQDLAFDLVLSLDPNQLRLAHISEAAPDELLSSPFQKEDPHRWRSTLARDGLAASMMDHAQLRLLAALLAEIFNRYPPAAVEDYRAGMTLEDLSFAWMGRLSKGEPHYFRILGKSFVYEFDAAQEGGNHFHTVWRDRHDDFGVSALRRHYIEHAH